MSHVKVLASYLRRMTPMILTLLLALPVITPARAADPAGTVNTIAGEAFAVAGSENRRLQTEANVFVGEVLKTGAASRLGVALGRVTTLRLGADTRLKIDRYIIDAGGEFTLEGGIMRFERSKPTKNPDLTIRSTYGVIAVRGTGFYAGPSGKTFGVFVRHGQVAVTSGGKTVLVGAGRGTDIAAPGRPPTPPRKWATARVRAMVDSVR